MSGVADFTPLPTTPVTDEFTLPEFVESREVLLARLTPRERFALHAAEMRRTLRPVTSPVMPTQSPQDGRNGLEATDTSSAADSMSVEALEARIARLAEEG